MKASKKNLLTLSIFSLYPLYSIPWIVRSILSGKRFGFFMLSLFMGVLAYLLIPYNTMDLTRYYSDFNIIQFFSLIEVIEKGGSHLFINILMWLLSSIGLPKEAMTLLIVSFAYYFHFLVLFYIIKDYPLAFRSIKNKLFILIFAFILLNEISFIGAASGLRNELAFSLSLLGVYFVFSRKKHIKGILILLFASFVHASAAILIVFILLSRIKKLHHIYRFLFLFSIFIIITGLSTFIFFSTMDILKPLLISMDMYHQAYFSRDGKWGAGFWSSFNFKTYVLEKYIKPLPFYVSAAYLVVVRSSAPDYRRLLYLLFFLISVISISRTLFDRYNYYTVHLFIIMIMLEYREQPFTRFKKIFLVLFISSLLIVDIANLYKFRDMYAPSWKKTLYVPLPILLLENVEPSEYIVRKGN